MKKIILLPAILLFFCQIHIMAQLDDPIKWSFSVKQLPNAEALLVIDAQIEPKWQLYSQYFPDGGPVKMKISFVPSKEYKLIGKVEEVTKPKKKFDEIFEIEVQYFEKKATLSQKIKILTDKDFVVRGEIESQGCYEVDGKCVLFSPEFEFKIKGAAQETESNTNQVEVDTIVQKDTVVKEKTPESQTITTEIIEKQEKEKSSVWGTFLLAFVLGLAGVLTPCVFPMIPMTVSFFMQGQTSKLNSTIKALIFGISIVVLYTSVGLIVSLTSAGADFATALSSHWIPNLLFFILFIAFAASFFGMFEIVLPTGLANKADRQVDKGGFLASFFMAFTLVIVSFSCTGPIVGALLVKAAGGDILEPLIGMFGFGLAFALPFTLLAIFPKMLKTMPKSGGWMNAVKVVLGFIILGFSLKFISNIDQAYHLGILSRDVYLAIWIVLFTLMGLYLLGKIKLSHDSDLPYVSVPRLVLAVVSFTFAVYLFPGMFGADLNAVSALIPPKSAQQFDLTENRQISVTGDKVHSSLCETPKYADILELPHGLQGYFDYEQGMACAKKLNKPVLLDFKGHQCANCKEMETKVWSNPEVLKRLHNDYIIIALYVDDRTSLPENEWITSSVDGKVKKTMGKKNADFQISKYNMNSQPYYVLVDTNGELLNQPTGHNLDIEKFIQFLDSGLEKFKAGN
jgi:thiol:disulfide interchange protein